MIGKLFKYDFKALMRWLLPVYGASIVSSVFTAVSLRNAASYSEENGSNLFSGLILGSFNASDTIAGTLIFIYSLLIIAASLLTVILVIGRFYKNLIGNEGYMMFAVPVKTSAHIFEKLMSGLVWAVIGGISICMSIFLMVIIGADINIGIFIEKLGEGFRILINENLLDDAFLWLGIILLGIIEGIIKIYGVIAIGHQWSNHKILGSFIAYIVVSTIENLISRIFMINMFFQDNFQMNHMYLPIYIILIFEIAAYSIITWWLLDRKLNLE